MAAITILDYASFALIVGNENLRPIGLQTYRVVTELQVSNQSKFGLDAIVPFDATRPKPSVPQFDGTVSPAREVGVSLRRANRTFLETVYSDVNGYFEFGGWYYPHTDYEYVIHGDDTYQMKVYPVSTPVEHRWNGAPNRNDSTVIV